MWWVGGLALLLCIYAIVKVYGHWLMMIPWWQIHNVLRFWAWLMVFIIGMLLAAHLMSGGPSPRLNGHTSVPLAR